MLMIPELVPLTDAAHRLGRSYEITRRLVLTNRLVGRRIGRSWFVDADSLARFQQSPDNQSSEDS